MIQVQRLPKTAEVVKTKAVLLLNPILLDRRQTAKVLAVSLSTIDNLVASGNLPSVRVGGRRMFRPAELERWASGLPSAPSRQLIPDDY